MTIDFSYAPLILLSLVVIYQQLLMWQVREALEETMYAHNNLVDSLTELFEAAENAGE